MSTFTSSLSRPLELPCGVILKNRIAKSAMSDSLADGRGNPTPAQIRLYERWAEGGLALSIIGEVQGTPAYPEKPGNLVLREDSSIKDFERLSTRGSSTGSHLWLQLGHAGALSHSPISSPKGPSEIDIPDLKCGSFTSNEIADLPSEFARTASLAKSTGFGGVEIHAAHGFLLSQFLSPLFNRRTDNYGGPLSSRLKLLLDVITEVRHSVGPEFPISIKLNSTDHLEGGLTESDSLQIISALDTTSIDIIDISGGTYFPGARSSSDTSSSGPYYLDFARHARSLTTKPLMLTGGFKTYEQAESAITADGIDIIGLARALAISPDLPNAWLSGSLESPSFPRFTDPPTGGITAWYTMCLTSLGEDRDLPDSKNLNSAIQTYESRDEQRIPLWKFRFEL